MAYRKIEEYDPKTTQEIAAHIEAILKLLGEDPTREGLQKTPERVAKAMQFLTQGYFQNGETIVKSALFQEPYNHMVIVKDIELFSLCEHHMLPFIGKAHVAYIPKGEISHAHLHVHARRTKVQRRHHHIGLLGHFPQKRQNPQRVPAAHWPIACQFVSHNGLAQDLSI